MKDRIQFDSKYNFDLPINHYILSFPWQTKESVLNIILFFCHICSVHRTLLHLILQNIPQSNVLFVLFQTSFHSSLLFFHSIFFILTHSISRFSLFVFETLAAPNNIVNRTKSEDNNIIDTKCMGLRLNSIFLFL